jgi:Na+/H+-dicarboxylate symporter
MKIWFGIALWKRVLGALALGLVFALVWPQGTPYVQFMGDLFVRAIRMLVAPIVLVTIAAGITALADPKRLGGLGGRTIGLFALTTAIAVSVGCWSRHWCSRASARRSAPRRRMRWAIGDAL